MLSGGGDAAVKRVDGGVKLAGVLWVAAARSGAWERGESKRTCGMGLWGLSSARARARGGRRPLPWPGHGDGEVATMRRLWAAWHCRGGSSAQPRAVEEEQRDAWAPARRRTWPGRLSTAPATCTAAAGRNRASRQAGGGRKDLSAISKNSRNPTVKQR